MKHYTSIEQSKKLAEILPIESADMWYSERYAGNVTENGEYIVSDVPCYYLSLDKPSEYNCSLDLIKDIPCWSLSALLNALPPSIPKYIKSESCQKTFHLNLFRSHYYCCSYSFNPSISDNDGNNTLYCVGRDNWVDSCYEMIIKLNELKML